MANSGNCLLEISLKLLAIRLIPLLIEARMVGKIQSNRSVTEREDEVNLLERCKAFKADGFIGFCSTIESSGLNQRLTQLKNEREIQDYKIFDGKYIENVLMNYGLTKIILRYFPESYKRIRPLHKIASKFVSLNCDCCGRDLFEDVEKGLQDSVIASVEKYENGKIYIKDLYVACKGLCDDKLENKWNEENNVPEEFIKLVREELDKYVS